MRRLHPTSAVFRALGLGISFGSFGLFGGFALEAILESGLALLLPALLGVIGFGGGVALGVARYYRFAYDVSGGTLSIQSGVFDRQERDIPLDRIQNVDIRRNLLNRALGLAVVRFETAGGASTEGVLNAVSYEEASRLQDAVARREEHESERTAASPEATTGATPSVEEEVGTTATETGPVEVAAGAEPAGGAGAPPTPEPSGTAEQELFSLSSGDLFVLSMVSFRPTAPLLVIFGLPILSDVAIRLFSRSLLALGGPEVQSVEQLLQLPPPEGLLVVIVGGIQLFLVTWVTSALLTANGYYDFRLTRVGDDLRYERGFLQRYSGTIPLDKVQTITIRENVLMRNFGYGSLALETAGYGPGQSDSDAANTAIPLGDRGTVVEMAEELGEVSVPDVKRPPRRARRRYAVRFSLVVLAIEAALLTIDTFLYAHPWWIALVGLLVTPVAGHYRWRHRGHALTEPAFVARDGFWRRQTRFVPYYRVQTAIDERTVFQRWRDLASVTADTASSASIVGGDATAHDIDEARARSLHPTVLDRLQADLVGSQEGRGEGRGDDEAATS